MKVHGGLFVICVYMPTDIVAVVDSNCCYDRLKEDVLGFRKRGQLYY